MSLIMYSCDRKWIQAEIDIAAKYNKPIIGIKNRENAEAPPAIQEAADVMVEWNREAIVDAVKAFAAR